MYMCVCIYIYMKGDLYNMSREFVNILTFLSVYEIFLQTIEVLTTRAADFGPLMILARK